MVTCVLLAISAVWPQTNVKAYVYPTGSVRCPSGIIQARAGLGTSYDQSYGLVRGMCGANKGSIETIRPASPYIKLPASLQAPCPGFNIFINT